MKQTIALIGFGEAGSTFSQAAGWGAGARGYDISRPRDVAMVKHGVRPCATPEEALAGASLILSLVTPGQALAAATDYAAFVSAGALWCDMNSVAPETKRAAAAVIEAQGGRYADVAVLAPVNPARLAVPLLVAGPNDKEAEAALRQAGFGNVRTVGHDVGRASAIKMIRSIMVKGVEALTDEMMAAARAAGVEAEVLASLDASAVVQPWAQQAMYNLERMATHGARRAAEMEECIVTLSALGVDPVMTRGTVVRQRAAASDEKADR